MASNPAGNPAQETPLDTILNKGDEQKLKKNYKKNLDITQNSIIIWVDGRKNHR